MKQLIIIIAVFCLSATTIVNNITVTPTKPKSVVAQSFWTPAAAVKFIRKYTVQGYILKEMTSQQEYTIIVMEKY